MDSFQQYLQYQQEVVEAKLKILARLRRGEKAASKKRTSKIRIAWHVLNNAGCPLHVSEIIKRAKQDFGIELERDSIVSGIVKKANAGNMFIKTAPNTFASIPQSSQ
jgi:hypothetical protein